MPLFRLTPIPSRLMDAAWQQSAQRAVVVVEAVDERAARTQVSHLVGAWVESVGAYRSFWVSPWEDPYFVTCVQEEEAGTGGEDQGAEL